MVKAIVLIAAEEVAVVECIVIISLATVLVIAGICRIRRIVVDVIIMLVLQLLL